MLFFITACNQDFLSLGELDGTEFQNHLFSMAVLSISDLLSIHDRVLARFKKKTKHFLQQSIIRIKIYILDIIHQNSRQSEPVA